MRRSGSGALASRLWTRMGLASVCPSLAAATSPAQRDRRSRSDLCIIVATLDVSFTVSGRPSLRTAAGNLSQSRSSKIQSWSSTFDDGSARLSALPMPPAAVMISAIVAHHALMRAA
jgi:hypothetical protein